MSAPPTLVAYVSGHGFGHSVRTATVLGAICALDPGLRIAVVTAGPDWVFREAVGPGLVFRAERADVGLVQKGALVIDTAATVAACEAFEREMPARVDKEAAWLRETGSAARPGRHPASRLPGRGAGGRARRRHVQLLVGLGLRAPRGPGARPLRARGGGRGGLRARDRPPAAPVRRGPLRFPATDAGASRRAPAQGDAFGRPPPPGPRTLAGGAPFLWRPGPARPGILRALEAAVVPVPERAHGLRRPPQRARDLPRGARHARDDVPRSRGRRRRRRSPSPATGS
jgi:hypothetical protein